MAQRAAERAKTLNQIAAEARAMSEVEQTAAQQREVRVKPPDARVHRVMDVGLEAPRPNTAVGDDKFAEML